MCLLQEKMVAHAIGKMVRTMLLSKTGTIPYLTLSLGNILIVRVKTFTKCIDKDCFSIIRLHFHIM